VKTSSRPHHSLPCQVAYSQLMIPHPPFASQLSLEEELAEFERLKPRLARVWPIIAWERDDPCTTVVVPSLTLPQGELAKLSGASYYEERLLFLLIRLRNPRARVVYVTSQPVHPQILDYLLQHLLGIPASHARQRLTMLSAADGSPRPLTLKILERPRLIERIRQAIPDRDSAYLSAFNVTPLERRLSVLLGIPINGVDPALAHLGTKSGSRKLFRESGVSHPAGFEDLKSEKDVVGALSTLRDERPGIRRAVIKLDDSFSGAGNALYDYPEESTSQALARALDGLKFTDASETRESYFAEFAVGGGIVEEYVDGVETRSPSVQLRTAPSGQVLLLSTHEQILGGPTGQVYEGCRFPADSAYRLAIQEAGQRVGGALADHGVVSRFGVDFMVTRPRPDAAWEYRAIEINLRLGGTTHPFLALRFLCGGGLHPASGLFHSASGHDKYYRATDNLWSPRYRGLLPEDVIEIFTINRLTFDYRTETGVLFHMIGAVSEFGKLGLTAIGNSPEEADMLFEDTLDALEEETAYG